MDRNFDIKTEAEDHLAQMAYLPPPIIPCASDIKIEDVPIAAHSDSSMELEWIDKAADLHDK